MPSSVALQIDPRWAPQVDAERLERAVLTALEVESIRGAPGVTVVVVGDDEMAQLHEAYRHVAGTTDVLAFPFDPESHDPEGEMAGYLGDIIICYPQAARQAEEEEHSTQDELDLLAVHGTLHLLGYDDEAPEARRRMEARQERIMLFLGLDDVAPRSAD